MYIRTYLYSPIYKDLYVLFYYTIIGICKSYILFFFAILYNILYICKYTIKSISVFRKMGARFPHKSSDEFAAVGGGYHPTFFFSLDYYLAGSPSLPSPAKWPLLSLGIFAVFSFPSSSSPLQVSK